MTMPCIEVLMNGTSALSSLATAFRSGVARWQRQPGRARHRSEPRLRRIGAYVLLDKLGAGAMGEVYRARHAASAAECALKLLPAGADERRRLQFEKEACFGEQLWHPNKVSVYEHGVGSDGTRYLVMELAHGSTLEALVARDGVLLPERVLDILLQLASVLAEVHDQGFVHRDIKPENILVGRTPSGRDHVKLLDFGLVKDLSEPAQSSAQDYVVGTPLYISPEALLAPESVDPRADIYGLGAVAYYLLSGAPVFQGRNVVDVCARHLHAAPAPLPDDSELGRLVLECLAKEPAARPQSARELARRLRVCRERMALRAQRPAA